MRGCLPVAFRPSKGMPTWRFQALDTLFKLHCIHSLKEADADDGARTAVERVAPERDTRHVAPAVAGSWWSEQFDRALLPNTTATVSCWLAAWVLVEVPCSHRAWIRAHLTCRLR